uniref:Uncharacterized protein n=1 Tax=Schizaphis graminum TaxID=13262 RepID=A0A2S2PSJ6_SCHGA
MSIVIGSYKPYNYLGKIIALFTFSCLIVFVVVWMVGVTGLVNDCVKTVFLVGYVFDGPQRTIGVVHAVRSLHHVTVSVLVRGLVVAGVRILHAVFVRVFWMSIVVHVVVVVVSSAATVTLRI